MPKIIVPSLNVAFDASYSTLLQSALAAGLSPPYGCRIGTCGQCKARVIDGRVTLVGDYDPAILSNEDRRQNLVLSCRSIAHTDTVIEWLNEIELGASNFETNEKAILSEQELIVSEAPVIAVDNNALSKNPITKTLREEKPMVRDVPNNKVMPMNRTESLNKLLRTLQNGSPDVEAAALISEDGLMIASALPQDLDDTRVAGMSATLLSLGTRAAAELGRGDIEQVIVRGNLGYTVMISAGRGVLLLVVTNENAKLGLVFFDMREAINDVNRIL